MEATSGGPPVICTIGDLVEDIVVDSTEVLVRGADVPAVITHHRGGSAANVAAVVARCGGRARFAGRVGDDRVGDRLLADLAALDVAFLGVRSGRTGTVVVLVEPDGERTMFSDRRTASELDVYDPAWLDGAAVVHVPYYSFQRDPLAAVASKACADARARGVTLSIDPSSVTLLGGDFFALLDRFRPDVVLCNEDEAAALGVTADGLPGVRLVVVKQGPDPVLLRGALTAEIATPPVSGELDTTGAGDAFAGGFLVALARGEDPVTAVRAGQAAAAHVVRGAGADAWVE